jgi:hypothetical protein
MMKIFTRHYFLLLIFITLSFSSYSQEKIQQSVTPSNKLISIETSSSSFLTVTGVFAAAVYLINPIILLENKRLYAGITKEFSVGFGKLGEHRTAIEYSFIFAGNIAHYVRLSYKYDILLKDNIKPSHMIQGTGVVSLGAGWFTDFKGGGVFPEVSYGYSLRNHKLLFFPYFKLRHTFMFKKDKSDITDFSFGVIFGIANPFIDVKIRNEE